MQTRRHHCVAESVREPPEIITNFKCKPIILCDWTVFHIFNTTDRTCCPNGQKWMGHGSWLSVAKQHKWLHICPWEACNNRTIKILIALCRVTGYNVQHWLNTLHYYNIVLTINKLEWIHNLLSLKCIVLNGINDISIKISLKMILVALFHNRKFWWFGCKTSQSHIKWTWIYTDILLNF